MRTATTMQNSGSDKQDKDSMRDIHHRLQQKIQDFFSSMNGWEDIRTKRGNTQKSERYYKTIIKNAIVANGGSIIREAGSQQKNDLTVLWQNDQQIVYELKKKDSKTGVFMCNDSVPDGNTVYIFIYTRLQTVQICDDVTNRLYNGMTLKNKENVDIGHIRHKLDAVEKDPCATNILQLGHYVMSFVSANVSEGIISLFDFGKFFKRNYYFTTCTFRPRPNFMICHDALQ